MSWLRNKFRWVGFLLAATLLTACGGGGGDDPKPSLDPQPTSLTGTVSGTVMSAATGKAVPGATLRAGATTVTSAADGSYTLAADVGERVVINIAAAGFAETFQVARVLAGKASSLGVQLLPIGVTRAIRVAAGDTVTVPDSSAQVTLPPGALVPATGGTPAATVNVSLTPINPAIDSRIMPGDFTALLSGSTTPVAIESFGALRVDVRDDNGTRYTLATGQTATLRIPLGTLSASPPATIPLLIFNETTGRWVEEGTATLAGTAGNLFYTGTVTQFGAWNADVPMTTVFVSGCVRDTANQPVENVSVRADGVNYSGSTSAVTAADGSFKVAVRRDGLATLDVTFMRNGQPVTKTVNNVGPYAADFTLTPCVTTEPAPLSMTARVLPPGITGTPYSARLAATNGTKPYSWSFSGALPTGLTLNSATGQISGTPTTAATFSGTLRVADSSTPVQSATAQFSITVTAPALLAIPSQSLPNGIVGIAYTTSLTAANGTQPYAWSVIAGALPTGLTLSTTGQISGTPTVAGTSFSVTIRAQDSSTPQQLTSAPFSITILPIGGGGGVASYTVGGSVSGLTGAVVLQNNGGDNLAVPASGVFTFTTPLANGAPYNVTVLTPPAGQTCSVANGTGTIAAANITTVAITCTASSSGSFSATGSMATARVWHTATPLPNGKVLVTGSQLSAELYDPATGNFSATGSMATARYYHTATLLPNGKVLVAGGSDGAFVGFNSAELYDPATGNFSATGSMAAGRRDHTATLLPNGKVLVTGGSTNSVALTSAELYDPATGSFSATSSMAAARWGHTATLLPNGKVLVTGGVGSVTLNGAELYDPATGNFSATGSMATARYNHTATLLPNGKVLFTGAAGSVALNSAELYDPATGNFSATGSMATARYHHTATLLANGKVLVIGGWNGSAALSSAELYDPATGNFSATGSMAAARWSHTATLLSNGKVLVTGGAGTNGSALNSAELFQ